MSGTEFRDVLSKRDAVLSLLLDEPKTKPDLVATLDCSRATVDRAVSELLEVNYVEQTKPGGRQFRATQTGATALATYQEYVETTDTLADASAVLNALPADAPFDHAFLRGADVHAPPDPARQPSMEILADTVRFYGASPVVYEAYFESQAEKLREDEFASEIIIDEPLYEQIQETYAEAFTDLTSYDSLDLYVSTSTIPYSLWLMEHDSNVYAGITTYEDGSITGLLINDTDRAVSWLRSEYNRYKSTATPLATYRGRR